MSSTPLATALVVPLEHLRILDHGTRSEVLERVGLTAQQITHDIVAQVLGTKVPFARPLPGHEHPSTGSLPIL